MRRWRAANPERTKEIARETMARWRENHPDEARTYTQKWRDEHPESIRETQIRQAARQKRLYATDAEYRAKITATNKANWNANRGIPERALQDRFATAHPTAVSMDRIRPDFYVPGEGFVEIKRAYTEPRTGWYQTSELFPGLFFPYVGRGSTRLVDAQIALQPRPLTVIVYHAATGVELCRRAFA